MSMGRRPLRFTNLHFQPTKLVSRSTPSPESRKWESLWSQVDESTKTRAHQPPPKASETRWRRPRLWHTGVVAFRFAWGREAGKREDAHLGLILQFRTEGSWIAPPLCWPVRQWNEKAEQIRKNQGGTNTRVWFWRWELAHLAGDVATGFEWAPCEGDAMGLGVNRRPMQASGWGERDEL